MNIESIAQFITNYLVYQWPFFFVAFLLGVVGQVLKKRVWTTERARQNRVYWWIRAFLPLHAPFFGFLLGLFGSLLLKEDMPRGAGVNGVGPISLYYAGAGGFSAWFYNLFKHFVTTKLGARIPSEFAENESNRPGPPSSRELGLPLAPTERPPDPLPTESAAKRSTHDKLFSGRG